MDRSAKVLIAEHDAAARRTVDDLLEGAGMRTATAIDGHEALRQFYAERPDAVVLALELPGLDGWEALATIRELSDVPVLVLAEEDREITKVRALRNGADDFMSKPFGRAEILARIEALLRRPRVVEDAPELFADDFVRIDHRRHEVEVLGREVRLTPTEFRMLAAFSQHAGQALTHSQLLTMVWGESHRERSEVKLYVSYLRRKLRSAGVEPVETVRGIGYRYRPRGLRSTKPGLVSGSRPAG
jgi:DNA-binding response OmpR family regulator